MEHTPEGKTSGTYCVNGAALIKNEAIDLAKCRRLFQHSKPFLIGLLVFGIMLPSARADLAVQTIYSFPTNSYNPKIGLVQGADGSLYGSTTIGGTNNSGSLFKFTSAGVLTTLFSFNAGANGGYPEGGLVLARDGNFYGTTAYGGSQGKGTIFRLSQDGSFTSLFSFAGANGSQPLGTMVQGQDGNLYGVAMAGGTSGYGTIFQMTTGGSVTTLFTFTGTSSPNPNGDLVQAPDGLLYGTTDRGGTFGNGTIYRISTNGAFSQIYSFPLGGGIHPDTGLIFGKDGFLYGTTAVGGTFNFGTIFRFQTNGTLTTLFSFAGTNGSNPQSPLMQASDGNFYGLTFQGGAGNKGAVFRFTTNGVYTLLSSLGGGYGGSPACQLLEAGDGSIYGTTADAGPAGGGTLIRLVKPPVAETMAVPTGQVVVRWPAFSNGRYKLEYKDTPSLPVWNTLVSSITASSNTCSFTDSPGIVKERYYRVVLLP